MDDRSVVGVDIGSYSIKAGWMNAGAAEGGPSVEFRLNPNISPFDDLSDVLYRGDKLESCLEEVLVRLNADKMDSAPSMLLTESWCAPATSRRLLAQLCFECFQVPAAWMAVDALVARSAVQSARDANEALIIRFGAFSTHVIPIYRGRANSRRSLRTDVGGYHCLSHLQRTLALQFPHHKDTLQQEYIIHNIIDSCVRVACPTYRDALSVLQPHPFQLPYHVPPQPTTENLALAIEKRQQNAARMRALIAKRQEARGDSGPPSSSSSSRVRISDSSEIQSRFRQVESMLASVQDPTQARTILDEFRSYLDNKLSSIQKEPEQAVTTRRNIERLRLLSAHGDERELDLTFGADDADWAVYQAMALDKPDLVDESAELRRQIVNYIKWADLQDAARLSSQEWNSLHASKSIVLLQADQFKTPEVLFQPSALLGVDQMGLSEMVVTSIRQFPHDTQRSMLQNIFTTGGNSKWRDLHKRLSSDLQSAFEPGTSINIFSSDTPQYDAFHGTWHNFRIGSYVPLTKVDYDELGHDRFLNLMASYPFANDPLN